MMIPMSGIQAIRKTRLVWGFALLGVIASALLWVGRAQAETLGFSLNASPAAGAAPGDVSVLVLDDETLKPLADASVTLAESLSDPSGSRLPSGADGASLFKGALAQPRTLSVAKDGYTTISLVGIRSAQVTIYLKALPSAAVEAAGDVLATGTLTGWPNSSPDNVVNAGLVLRSLSALDLLHFNVDSVISPLKDTIDIFGARQIPSNLVLPEQDIFLLFGSLTLNKPGYRLPLPRGKATSLSGVQGTIPVSDLVSLAQGGGKLSLGLLNKVKFTRAGVSQPMTPRNDFRLDVNSGFALKPQHRVTVATPPFAADVIVAAATDMLGDRSTLLPTDIKLALAAGASGPAKPVSLGAPDAAVGKVHDVLSIALGDKARRLSGIVTDAAGPAVSPGEFLASDALPDSATVPESLSVRPIATGLSAAVYEAGSTALWYVYVLPSSGASEVPSRRLPALERVTAYSVVQLDFGAAFDERSIDGPSAMRKLARFARSTAQVVKPQP